MKLSLGEIDDQIREVENRIALERLALDDAINGCTNSLREVATSPKTLLALLGVGFAVGKLMFRSKGVPQSTGPVKKAGMLGLLTGVAGTAISLAARRAAVTGVTRWAAARYFGRKKPSTGTVPDYVPPHRSNRTL